MKNGLGGFLVLAAWIWGAQNSRADDCSRYLVPKTPANLRHSAEGGTPTQAEITEYFAAIEGANLPKVKSMTEAKRSLLFATDRGHRGFTALMLAAQRGNAEMMDYLISAGARPNQSRASGDIWDKKMTHLAPVHLAAALGDSCPLRILIHHGASVAVQEDQMDRQATNCFMGEEEHQARTPLHYAATAGSVENIRLLLSAGLAVNQEGVVWEHTSGRYPDLARPLHLAAMGGHAEAVRALLAAGARPNEKKYHCEFQNERAVTTLHIAAANGTVEVIDALIDAGADVNALDASNDSPLVYAVRWQHPAVVRRLLRRGAAVNSSGSYNETPLIRAVLSSTKEVIHELLEGGADPNLLYPESTQNALPLHLAALRGDMEILNDLLNHGADVNRNAGPAMAYTPLEAALLVEHFGNLPQRFDPRTNMIEVVRLLVARGANLTETDRRGDNLVEQAIGTCRTDVVEFLLDRGIPIPPGAQFARLVSDECRGHSEKVQATSDLLRKHGVDLNGRDRKTGRTSLMLLTRRIDVDSPRWWQGYIESLVKAGADPRLKDDAGRSVIYFASSPFLPWLMKFGFDVNERDRDGRTALFFRLKHPDAMAREGRSFCHGEWECVNGTQLLLKAGAAVNVADRDGQTPLHQLTRRCFSYHRENMEILRDLLNASAKVNACDKDARTPVASTFLGFKDEFNDDMGLFSVSGDACRDFENALKEAGGSTQCGN